MRRFFTAILVMFFLGGSAYAKIPPEVLKPYKAYAAAKEKGDKKATYKNAKEAWETAEELMGDHKTTGDLAHNFAELRDTGKNPYKNYKTRLKARKRSIELARFYPEEQIGTVETDRTLKLAETSLILRIHTASGKTKEGGKGTYFDDVERAIEKHGLQGGVFEGDLEVLKSRYFNLRKQYLKSIEHADKAAAIYKNPTDTYTSHYPYLLPIYKGDSLKSMDKPIEAVLQYQTVMQNLEGQLPAEHPFIRRAFTKWMNTRSGLEDAGRLEEAEIAGLCECWPFEDYKSKVTPLKRIPPVMPSAFARGSRSGHVIVMYDVDDKGKPFNIRKISSTSKLLDQAALKSVEKWEFTERGSEEAENSRKDISNKITFRLMTSSGNILPER